MTNRFPLKFEKSLYVYVDFKKIYTINSKLTYSVSYVNQFNITHTSNHWKYVKGVNYSKNRDSEIQDFADTD